MFNVRSDLLHFTCCFYFAEILFSGEGELQIPRSEPWEADQNNASLICCRHHPTK